MSLHGLARLLILWLALLILYAIVHTAYDVVARGYIDLRWAAIWELLVVPSALAPLMLLTCALEQRRWQRRAQAAPDQASGSPRR